MQMELVRLFTHASCAVKMFKFYFVEQNHHMFFFYLLFFVSPFARSLEPD